MRQRVHRLIWLCVVVMFAAGSQRVYGWQRDCSPEEAYLHSIFAAVALPVTGSILGGMHKNYKWDYRYGTFGFFASALEIVSGGSFVDNRPGYQRLNHQDMSGWLWHIGRLEGHNPDHWWGGEVGGSGIFMAVPERWADAFYFNCAMYGGISLCPVRTDLFRVRCALGSEFSFFMPHVLYYVRPSVDVRIGDLFVVHGSLYQSVYGVNYQEQGYTAVDANKTLVEAGVSVPIAYPIILHVGLSQTSIGVQDNLAQITYSGLFLGMSWFF